MMISRWSLFLFLLAVTMTVSCTKKKVKDAQGTRPQVPVTQTQPIVGGDTAQTGAQSPTSPDTQVPTTPAVNPITSTQPAVTVPMIPAPQPTTPSTSIPSTTSPSTSPLRPPRPPQTIPDSPVGDPNDVSGDIPDGLMDPTDSSSGNSSSNSSPNVATTAPQIPNAPVPSLAVGGLDEGAKVVADKYEVIVPPGFVLHQNGNVPGMLVLGFANKADPKSYMRFYIKQQAVTDMRATFVNGTNAKEEKAVWEETQGNFQWKLIQTSFKAKDATHQITGFMLEIDGNTIYGFARSPAKETSLEAVKQLLQKISKKGPL